jgi:hypothetical protein
VRLRTIWLIASFVVVVPASIGFGIFLYQEKQERTRVISGAGALMAVDPDGLGELNQLYALPKACSKENPGACAVSQPVVSTQLVKKGLVLIPAGTTVMFIRPQYILPGGRLVDPYVANAYVMARDGAVAVEHIRITELNQNREGWVKSGSVERECCVP